MEEHVKSRDEPAEPPEIRDRFRRKNWEGNQVGEPDRCWKNPEMALTKKPSKGSVIRSFQRSSKMMTEHRPDLAHPDDIGCPAPRGSWGWGARLGLRGVDSEVASAGVGL